MPATYERTPEYVNYHTTPDPWMTLPPLNDPTHTVTVGNSAHGHVTMDPASGDFTYTPDAGFHGVDRFSLEIKTWADQWGHSTDVHDYIFFVTV